MVFQILQGRGKLAGPRALASSDLVQDAVEKLHDPKLVMGQQDQLFHGFELCDALILPLQGDDQDRVRGWFFALKIDQRELTAPGCFAGIALPFGQKDSIPWFRYKFLPVVAVGDPSFQAEGKTVAFSVCDLTVVAPDSGNGLDAVYGGYDQIMKGHGAHLMLIIAEIINNSRNFYEIVSEITNINRFMHCGWFRCVLE